MSTRPLLATGVAVGLLVAACSSSSKPVAAPTAPPTSSPPTSSPAPSTSSPAAPTSSAAPATSTPAASPTTAVGVAALASVGPATATGRTLSLARSPQGIFVIAANGRSLYVFAKDAGTTSACTGGCAGAWPALTVSGPLSAGPAVSTAQMGTARGQAANQVTYYGHLLYMFSGDTAPGQTNGVGIPDWHLLGPFGNVMLPR